MYRAVYPHALGLRGSKYGGVRRGYTVVSVSKLFAVVALAVLSFGFQTGGSDSLSFIVLNCSAPEGGLHHAPIFRFRGTVVHHSG